MVGTQKQQDDRRQQVLDHIRIAHPDLWRMSFEVDVSLLAYMADMNADERAAIGVAMARNVEVFRGASKIG